MISKKGKNNALIMWTKRVTNEGEKNKALNKLNWLTSFVYVIKVCHV